MVDSNNPSNSPFLKTLISLFGLLVFSGFWYNILVLYLPFLSDLGFISVLLLGISIVLLFLANWNEYVFGYMISLTGIWIFLSLFLDWIFYLFLKWIQPSIPVLDNSLLISVAVLMFFIILYPLKGRLITFNLEDITKTLETTDNYNSRY